MQPIPVTLRCPRCGRLLSALPPPGPGFLWAQCPSCAYPVPVIHPRDPAPLFSWEAFPHLLPRAGIPWSSSTVGRTLTNVLLGISLVLMVGLVALLFTTGAGAFPQHQYTVSGTVNEASPFSPGTVALAGATVRVTGSDGFSATTTSAADGSFSVGGVPSGGIVLNVTASGFAPTQLDLFDSPVYSAPSGGTVGINVTLAPGSDVNGALLVESEFPSLEALIATLWAGAIVLAVAAGIVGAAFRLDRRGEHPAWGVAGAGASLVAPVAILELSLGGVVPLSVPLSLGLGLAGAIAFVLALVRLALVSPPQPPSVDGL
jgi:hypothetical protein